MISDRILDEAYLADHLAGQTSDPEQKIILSMMANRLRRLHDDAAQTTVFRPPPRLVHSATVIPFPRFCDVTPTPPEAVA